MTFYAVFLPCVCPMAASVISDDITRNEDGSKLRGLSSQPQKVKSDVETPTNGVMSGFRRYSLVRISAKIIFKRVVFRNDFASWIIKKACN